MVSEFTAPTPEEVGGSNDANPAGAVGDGGLAESLGLGPEQSPEPEAPTPDGAESAPVPSPEVTGPDGASWTPPETIAEGWNPVIEGYMRETFAEEGLTSEQSAAILNKYAGVREAEANALVKAGAYIRDEGQRQLRSEWRGEFQGRADAAAASFVDFFGDDAAEFAGTLLADGSIIGDHPAVMRVFDRLARGLAVSSPAATPQDPDNPDTPQAGQSILDQIDAFMHEHSDILHNRQHPLHDQLQRRLDALYKVAYPGIVEMEDEMGFGI